MSDIKIQPSATGSGTVTITAPTTNTARVITLPDSAGTLLDENSSVPSANLTGTVVDARISALTASKLTGDLPAISGVNVTNVHAVNSGRKNWIINGDFQVSQRAAFTSATALTTSSVFHLDRFKSKHNNISGTVTHKLAQTVNGKVTNTMLLTATAGSNGRVEGVQRIEATQPFVSQTITFSAWVKSNSASSRLIIHQDGANIQTSSNQHTGGGAFELLKGTVTCAANSGNLYLYAGIQAAGTGNVAIANGHYFEMAFVQLELGSVATDFEHRSYGEELALCQRYFERRSYTGSAVVTIGTAYEATHCMAGMNFMEKRAIPSITMPACSAAGFSFLTAIANYPSNHGTMTVTGSTISKNNFRFASVNGAGHTAGDATWVHSGGTNHIDIDSEL